MTIIGNGKRYSEVIHASEKEFEDDIVASSRILFGRDTIYINAKKKIEAKALGGTIPDGFFFDFTDITDPQFYVVEVEVTQHSFFSHVFPQITKFFAFFKNTKLRKELVDKLYSIIDKDDALKSAFKSFLDKTEVYKFLSDVIESNQNILLIADGHMDELPEIIDTYSDTWGKLVKFLEIHKFVSGSDTIYTITPDFDTIQYIEPSEKLQEDEEETTVISEKFHLEEVSQIVRDIYAKIKEITLNKDGSIVFNPQKYYISIKGPKNIAYIKLRNKKIRFIAMIPEEIIRNTVKHYAIASLSSGVQNFYNGPCAAVDITDLNYEEDLRLLLNVLLDYYKKSNK
ncbi:MAG: hypothetical protein WBW94_17615 [Anaerolineales bacterium]